MRPFHQGVAAWNAHGTQDTIEVPLPRRPPEERLFPNMPGMIDVVLVAPVADLLPKAVGIQFADRVQEIAAEFFRLGTNVVVEAGKVGNQIITRLAAEGFEKEWGPGQLASVRTLVIGKGSGHGVAKVLAITLIELLLIELNKCGNRLPAHQVHRTPEIVSEA